MTGGSGSLEAMAFGLRIAVDDDIAQKSQQLGGPVAARFELKQFRRGVDQGGGRLAGAENGVGDDVFQKRNIRLDAADAKFAQGAVHALQGQLEIRP
jgi:hypothetical protein